MLSRFVLEICKLKITSIQLKITFIKYISQGSIVMSYEVVIGLCIEFFVKIITFNRTYFSF